MPCLKFAQNVDQVGVGAGDAFSGLEDMLLDPARPSALIFRGDGPSEPAEVMRSPPCRDFSAPWVGTQHGRHRRDFRALEAGLRARRARHRR